MFLTSYIHIHTHMLTAKWGHYFKSGHGLGVCKREHVFININTKDTHCFEIPATWTYMYTHYGTYRKQAPNIFKAYILFECCNASKILSSSKFTFASIFRGWLNTHTHAHKEENSKHWPSHSKKNAAMQQYTVLLKPEHGNKAFVSHFENLMMK